MNIDASDPTNPVITVKSPANAFIGRYKVAIYLESTIDGKTEYALDEEPDIILLCNPWCEDDSGKVFLYRTSHRESLTIFLRWADIGRMRGYHIFSLYGQRRRKK